jgi:NAD(P)-dependent dehydrogenase (short-subunit alcohol dehydrogenase family)
VRFKDQVVVVTGSARGIGFAAARQFAKEGARVVVNDLDPAQVEAAVRTIEAEGAQALGAPGDVSDAEQVRRNLDVVLAAHGQVDVLVNNAGIMRRARADQLDAQTWRSVLGVNLDGTFHWSQQVAARSMIPRRAGAIVNVASMAGLVGIPNAAAYVASKHAVVGLTKALAIDWAQYGIRLNAVCPGMTHSDLSKADRESNPEMFVERERRIPLGRAATLEEQAHAILFLASAEAGSVHGHAMVIDGGNIALSSGHLTPRGAG